MMQPDFFYPLLSTGMWGGFFTVNTVMVVTCLWLYVEHRLRVCLEAAALGLGALLYVGLHLFYIPKQGDNGTVSIMLSLVTLVTTCSQFAVYLVATAHSHKRQKQKTYQHLMLLALIGCAAASAFVPVHTVWWLTHSIAVGICIWAFVGSLREYLRSIPFAGMLSMITFNALVLLLCMSWIDYHHGQVPPIAWLPPAVAGTVYILQITIVMVWRFYYLFELYRATSAGTKYDPITRTYPILQVLLREVPHRRISNTQNAAILAIAIGNLSRLEETYGLAAANHALFVLMGRIRRTADTSAIIGRSNNKNTHDVLFVIVPQPESWKDVVELGKHLVERLSNTIELGLPRGFVADHSSEARLWVPEIGLALHHCPLAHLQEAAIYIGLESAARQAVSLPGRMGYFNAQEGKISTAKLKKNT